MTRKRKAQKRVACPPARGLAFARKVEKAMRIAVAETLEDHRRSGDPIAVWKNGRVVKFRPAAFRARSWPGSEAFKFTPKLGRDLSGPAQMQFKEKSDSI